MRLIDADTVADAVCDAIFDETSIELRRYELEKIENAVKSIPTAMQLWTSVKDALPTADGIYFTVYKFLNWNDCISTREFRNGKWVEEVGHEEVRFWMPIAALPEDNA
jgi:hypothetical protein|nr:MAG TPA: Protein of unknown function (DUF551) [Caudoviricetes sp.]